MLLKVSVALPVLVMVTYCDTLEVPTVTSPKERLVADNVANAAESPVPLKAILCGNVVALSVMEIAAVSAPVAAGSKCP